VLFSDATRASLRPRLHARTLPVFRLSESGFAANDRGICDRDLVSPGFLAVLIVAIALLLGGRRLRLG